MRSRWRATIAALSGKDGVDIWIAVNTAGEYEGDGEADEDAVATQWTTVVMADDKLAFLHETLALNAEADDDGRLDEDLDPLD